VAKQCQTIITRVILEAIPKLYLLLIRVNRFVQEYVSQQDIQDILEWLKHFVN
jgi:hypothetical protein